METFFDFNIAEEKIRRLKEYFDGLKTGGKNVYIFGVGGYAEKLNQHLQKKGIAVKGFVLNDHFASKFPEVIPLSRVAALDNMSLVFGLASGYSKWFYKQIGQIQKAISKCESSDFFVISDYWLAEEGLFSHAFVDDSFLKEHFEDFKQTYEMLADDLSKKVMTEYLYASICHDATNLAQLGSDWNYDYDLKLLFDKCGEGLVIECGAFDGKTISECSLFTNNKYEMLALECDDVNYDKCCAKTKDFPNIKVVKLGAWNKKTKLAVVQQDSASYLKEVDDSVVLENVVEVVDIDSLVGSKRVAALIMDIEGSELNALKGAQNAIKGGANLAVRAYHKKEDLITIPQYIKSLNNAYKFYLRFERGANLCRTGDETTFYAICE